MTSTAAKMASTVAISTRRWIPLLAGVAAITVARVAVPGAEPIAHAAGFVGAPSVISGTSPDQLGTWTVHYQRVDGGDPALAGQINDRLDAEATREVQQATWDGSTRRPWTFDADGTLQVGPMTVSEVFVGQYNTNEAHMPIQSVASIVCDSRSGVPITWDNLFVDKQAGLTRLGDATAAALADVAPPDHVRDSRRQGQFAPVDINFKAWIPTAQGIELHFPEFQFGGALKVVTVPWATVADQIRPEFTPIVGG
jgi:hypothetical protein